MYTTDRRQAKTSLNAPPIRGGGIMRRLVWSPARGSLTAACLSFFTLSFIGLTYLNVSSISSAWWYTGVSVAALPVPGDVLCSGLFNCRQAASAFCCSSSVGGTVSPPQHVWSSGFRNCRPYDVELTANTPSSCGEQHSCIWTIT